MVFWGNRKNKQKILKKEEMVEDISVTTEDIRLAVNEFAKTIEEGISLRIIILENNEIDYKVLQEYLGGKPNRSFYMSKETFEVFTESEYPKYIDLCQVACDQYFLETEEEPVTPGDKTRKINYFKLKNYLFDKPPFDLYLDPDDRMVTHRKPTEK